MDGTTRYYLIRNRNVGKREKGQYYIFTEGRWRQDRHVITDLLWGYDPYEPEDSPYRTGSLSVMDGIEEITADMAETLLGKKG